MGLELSDIGKEEAVSFKVLRDPVGVILILDEGGWHASSPDGEVQLSGPGLPDDLPAGHLWFVNQRFNQAQTLQNGQSRRDIRIRGQDWFRSDLNDIMAEWSLHSVAPAQRSIMMSKILTRVIDLSMDTVRAVRTSSRMTGKKEVMKDAQVLQSVERAPSLGTGFRNVIGTVLDASVPKEAKLDQLMMNAMRFGGYIGEMQEFSEDEITIRFRRPRFAHALEVAAARVPAPGRWQKARVSEDVLSEETIDEIIALGKPALIAGKPVPKQGQEDAFLTSWTRNQGHGWSRRSYTIDEVIVMRDYFSFRSPEVLVGSSWQHSSLSVALEHMAEMCGTPALAHTSWSAGLVAENLLCGWFRPGRKTGKGEDCVAPESVWLAANDRILMRDAITRLTDVGASVFGAYAGEIRVRAPRDPEILTLIMNTAWEAGLITPISTMADLKSMGVEPDTDMANFGGSQAPAILARFMQRGAIGPLWKIDEIIELEPEARGSAFQKLLS